MAVLQPGYLPWLGYFDQMARCDVFVCLDDVQYTKQDWRNRNRVKGEAGPIWLAVPIRKHSLRTRIGDIEIDDTHLWRRKHWRTIEQCYHSAPHFEAAGPELAAMYANDWRRLVDLDRAMVEWSCKQLGLTPTIVYASDLEIESDDPNERLLEIADRLGATVFYEGSAGRDYLDLDRFASRGVIVEFQDFAHPYYSQQWPKVGFVSHLSALDLILNVGPEAGAVLTGKLLVEKPVGVEIILGNDFATSGAAR